jgi:hypothetical protein
MNYKKLIPWIASLFICLPAAFAFFLDPVFQSLSLVDLPGFYIRFAYFIDTILYMILFGAISIKILKERLSKKAAVVVGIVLGISLELFFYNRGITLVAFGPIAVAIFLFILAVSLYYVVKAMTSHGDDKLGAWMAYVIILPLFMGTVPEFFDWMKDGGAYIGALYGLMMLLWVVGLIYIIVRLFTAMNWPGGGTPSTPPTGSTPPGTTTPPTITGTGDIEQKIEDLRVLVRNYSREVMQIHRIADRQVPHRGAAAPATRRLATLGRAMTQLRRNDIEQNINTQTSDILNDPHFANLDRAQKRLFQQAIHDFATHEALKQQAFNWLVHGVRR